MNKTDFLMFHCRNIDKEGIPEGDIKTGAILKESIIAIYPIYNEYHKSLIVADYILKNNECDKLHSCEAIETTEELLKLI